MAITYSPVEIRETFAELLPKILFQTPTLSRSLVDVQEARGGKIVFSEVDTVANLNAYTGVAPTYSGSSIDFNDRTVLPVLLESANKFNPITYRASRIGSQIATTAWEGIDNDVLRAVADHYAQNVAITAESRFWNGITSATQVAIAALTPGVGQGSVGAAEQTYAAAATTSLFDGIVTRMIYQNGALGGRVKVAGTTITASNIKDEYEKMFNAIPSVNLSAFNATSLRIYAPYSHKKLIPSFNLNQTYRGDLFTGSVESGFQFQGIDIEFVPLPENCIICAFPENLVWCLDSANDLSFLKIDRVQADSEEMFFKMVYAQEAYVRRAVNNVLYLG